MRSLSLYRFAGNGDRFDRCRKLIKTLTLKPKERTCAIALARYQASLAQFLEMLRDGRLGKIETIAEIVAAAAITLGQLPDDRQS